MKILDIHGALRERDGGAQEGKEGDGVVATMKRRFSMTSAPVSTTALSTSATGAHYCRGHGPLVARFGISHAIILGFAKLRDLKTIVVYLFFMVMKIFNVSHLRLLEANQA